MTFLDLRGSFDLLNMDVPNTGENNHLGPKIFIKVKSPLPGFDFYLAVEAVKKIFIFLLIFYL